MSKVALRVYNHEIEALVDQGHIDEAVAHCQHILKTYPKHLETYRLLGKAYLEARRYPDAADIFQRVLTSVPDDFVSHLGMSIVYDEQKNLDQAIWHMERAYESIPSNGGVQAELRRLYGRRDGLEPPKIQLTRGALAKMYIRGAQYGQAIQEIKTVLQEDKERLDLKVLLAQAYFRFDKKVEATEMCNEILKVSPYCFDANRVMVEILPGTGLASNLETYKKRLQQLDPYTALVTGSTFEVAAVQDAAVTIERLQWDPSAAAQVATDWQPDSEPVAEEDVDSGEDIPGWMKTSGWGPSSGEFQEGPVDFDESAGAPADELATAEIPDWLKAMAPPGSSETQSRGGDETESQDADLDWLSGISSASGIALAAAGAETEQPAAMQAEPESPAAEDDNSDWLAGLGTESEQPAAPQAEAPSDVPDWLTGLGAETEQPAAMQAEPESPAAEDDNSDWLAGLGAESEQPAAPQAEAPSDVPDWLTGLGAESEQPAAMQAEPESPAAEDDNSDWLAGLGAESEQPAAPQVEAPSDVPDWLTGLGAETEQPAAMQAEPESPAAEVDNSDWLAGLGAESEQPSVPQTEAASDVPDWLAGLGAETEQPAAMQAEPESPAAEEDNSDWLAGLGAESEQPSVPQTEAASDVPDWLAGLGAETEQPVMSDESKLQPDVQAEPASEWLAGRSDSDGEQAEGEPLSALISGPGTSETEQDEAFKWLESLAAGQGAKPEELLTQPEERLEQAPGWVESVDSAPAMPADVESPQSVSQPLSEIEDEPAMGELSALVTAPGTSELEQDDAFKWLESLAAGQGAKPEELLTKPEERLEQAPGWVDDVESAPTTPAAVEPAQSVSQPSSEIEDESLGELSALVTAPGTSELEQDDAFKWLESLAAGQGAKPEELLTKPEERLEQSPDWVADFESVPATPATVEPAQFVSQPSSEIEDEPLGELSALVTAPGTSELEQDDAFKWLESLAAGQGAKPEELLTAPEERLEQSPDWVADFESVPATPAAVEPAQFVPEPPIEVEDEPAMGELSALVTAPGTSELEQDDAFKWLESLAAGQGAKPEELLTAPEERLEQSPDWVADFESVPATPAAVEPAQFVPEPPIEVEDEPAMGELSALVTAPGTSELEQDDAFKWLESLAAGQGAKPEELLTKPEERLEQAPGWVDDVENPPPALSELISGPGTSQDDQDESFKWLENLAAGQGAKPEELLTKPEERLDRSPEWLAESASEPEASSSIESLHEPVVEEPLANQFDQIEAPLADESDGEIFQPSAQAEVEFAQPESQMEDEDQPLAELSAPVMAPGMSENDQDEAFKWLENLAAGQGAKPEELLTKPEERLEQSPDWVAEFESQPDQEPVAQIVADAAAPEPNITDPTLDWFAPGEPEQTQAVDEPGVVTNSDLDQMGVTQWLETLEDEEIHSQPQVAGSGPAVSEDLPDWLKDETGDELPPAPVPVSGWVAEEELLPSLKLDADSPEAADVLPETGIQAPAESAPQPVPVAAEVESAPPVARREVPAPPPPPRMAVRQTGMLGGDKDAMLLQRSRLLLDKANLDTAMSEYSRLIKKGKYIDEIVFDLQEATYSHPVDVIVWQTLGDAYMRNNRLQEALDAYTKAEELLR